MPPLRDTPEDHRRERVPQTVELEIDDNSAPVTVEPGSWFVCFVPGLERQWWHRFVNHRHKHVFALRPESDGHWTVFEPWWTRMLTATISADQARKFLRWGSHGDVLLVRESVPGRGSQLRGWMNCAALASYMLGRPYWVWTPHGLYRRLLQELRVCRVDVSVLLDSDLSRFEPEDSRVIGSCPHCAPEAPRPPGALKPFCMSCGRDLARY